MKIMKLTLPVLSLFLLGNCASHSYMTPTSMIKPDSLVQINEDDIRNAFNTKPQLTKPLIAAIYNAGTDKNALIDSIEKYTDIKSAFEISPWLMEGEEYKSRLENRWGRYSEPRPAPIKAIRLEAAKGKADIVIYCGITHRYRQDANWLSWTYIGLLPAFFVPGQKCIMNSSIDIFIIDVRNGFMYGNYHDDVVDMKAYVTLSYDGTIEFENWKKIQENALLAGSAKAISRILNNPEFYLKK